MNEQEMRDYIAALEAALQQDPEAWADFQDAQAESLPVPDVPDFSPPEVQGIAGWQHVELMPDSVGKIRRGHWLHPTKSKDGPDYDPGAGINLSNERSLGCRMVQNQRVTAFNWMDAPEKWAERYSSKNRLFSPRLIFMAGSMMNNRPWFMFPTEHYGKRLSPYVPEPAVAPYNADEGRIWREMFSNYHFVPDQQKMLMIKNIESNPEDDPDERLIIDPSGQHKLLTVAGHPNWILLAAIRYWTTDLFKKEMYRWAAAKAYRTDHGEAPTVGWTPRTDWGGPESHADAVEWYEKWEDDARGADFPAGRAEFPEEV